MKRTERILFVLFPCLAMLLVVTNSQVQGNVEPLTAPFPAPTGAVDPRLLVFFVSGLVGFIVRFLRRTFEQVKRLFDLVVAYVGLAFALPWLAIAAFLIKIDSAGPVLYRQKRLGKDGRIFDIYKLRTMIPGAERASGAVWASKNDPRITRVGRVLRKLRMDEVPQLYNVIRGDMSFIGPRPERPEIARNLTRVIAGYEKRLAVKPGITGLAQVLHKYDETIEDVKKKVAYDLLYIRKMCFLTDLGIVARTFTVVATGKGAH